MRGAGKFVGFCGVVLAVVSTLILAAGQSTHAGVSTNVVIIGGSTLSPDGSVINAANVMGCTSGGYLPVTGPIGELGDFNFFAMTPSQVNARSLANFDTAVLNLGSVALACNFKQLSSQQKSDLLNFVAAGKKLIIYDSRCGAVVDYGWLPFFFFTSNPGAGNGASGGLTVLEDSSLASFNPAGSSYINATQLVANTDAAGNANVMVYHSSNWCVNMSATNRLGVTGPVHCYAFYPSSTDKGLIIYNGLSQCGQYSNDPWLRKIWVLELKQPFNPSGLPCGPPALKPVTITLSPSSTSKQVGSQHTVTTVLKDCDGVPQSGIPVTFVVSGVNAGVSGTCNPANAKTDADGCVKFTYCSNGQVGSDIITACFVNQQGQQICTEARAEWVQAPPGQDDEDYYVFDKGKLKPIVNGCPQRFCIDVALKPVLDQSGRKIKDPITGCPKMEYDWTNSEFMWRKCDASSVQSVVLEKIHTTRKGACGLAWKNEHISQQGKEYATSEINLCWPLLYETEGTKWVLSIVYQTDPAIPNPSGRLATVHKERYVWKVDWKAPDFSEFRARLNYFAGVPAGQCELSVIPPLKLRQILWLLDGYGCLDFFTYSPGITALLSMASVETDPAKKKLLLEEAANKAAKLENLIDENSCISPCIFCNDLPCRHATGILNNDRTPAGSVLLTDLYYAANEAGLFRDF